MAEDVSKASLERLLKTLLALGQEKPAVLLSLTQVVQPLLQDEYRVPLLARMFQDAPKLLSALSDAQLVELVVKPPPDAVALKLLLDLRSLLSLLRAMSYLQLAHLSKALAGHAPSHALRQLEQLQSALQGWGLASLRAHHDSLAGTPVHLERATLMRLEPLLPVENVALCVQLLKMPYEELESLKLWLEALTNAQMILLVNLLQMELQELLDVRRRLTEGTKAPGALTGKRSREQLETDATAAQMQHLRLSGERERKLARTEDGPRGGSRLESDMDIGLGMSMGIGIDLDVTDGGLDLALDMNMDLGMDSGTMNWDDALELGGEVDENLPDAAPYLDAPLSLSQMVTPPAYFEIKPEPISNYSPDASGALSLSTAPHVILPMPGVPLGLPTWQLRIQKQPPAQTVYQRIVKPFPAIALVTTGSSSSQSAQFNLFVEATVIRADSEKELPLCLDGSRVIRIQAGALATYRKLKILATTAQQGCLFRIKFQLKRYEGNQFYTVPGAVCISNPIEVFSHTYYLTNRKKNAPPPPPSVTEVLPARISAHASQRCVVLGAGFIDSPQLRVRVGAVAVRPVFHESKTLVVTLAAMERGTQAVSVANDGKDFCQSSVTITFE